MYPLVAKKWTKQKSDLAIETAFQKEAYPENFINIGWPQAKWIHHLPTWPQGVDDIYLSIGFTETKYIKINTKTQILINNIWLLYTL